MIALRLSDRTMVRYDVDADSAAVIRDDAAQSFFLSPDGRFGLCTCRGRGYPSGSWFLFALDAPHELTPIHFTRAPGDTGSVWVHWSPRSPRRPYLDTLRIVGGPGEPRLGHPYRLRATGVDSGGRAIEIGVVRWRSLDTAVATVDSTGMLTPRGVGRARIVASAGGWRVATQTLAIAEPATASTVLDERWSSSRLAPAWTPFGLPEPAVVDDSALGRAFSNGGDGEFSSGAYTRHTYDTRAGLWLEATLSVPLTLTGAGQEQALALVTPDTSLRWRTWDHRTGHVPFPLGCALRYPTRAQPGGADSAWFATPDGVGGVRRAPDGLRDGRRFRALVQIFPDGRCGFAIDGTPLAVTPTPYPSIAARVMLWGNTQDARVLVGPLTVVTGVAPHVDWSAPPNTPP